MISNGIIYINNILSDTGQTLGYYGQMGIMDKYNIKLNFVDFYSLTHEIPRNWLRGFNTYLNQCEMKQCLLEKQKNLSKWVYKELASSVEHSKGHDALQKNMLVC